MIYRGHLIIRRRYQGTLCYSSPSFDGGALAASLATIRRWIDCAIAAGELARGVDSHLRRQTVDI